MPLDSMPLAVISIGSSFHSGVGAAASFPGVQFIGGGLSPLRGGAAGPGRSSRAVWRYGAWPPSHRGPLSRLSRAIPIATCFARHRASWVGCLPPQLGHINSAREQIPPAFSQVDTSHLCASIRCNPEQTAHTGAPLWWQRNSLCPHRLHLAHSVSTLSTMNGLAAPAWRANGSDTVATATP